MKLYKTLALMFALALALSSCNLGGGSTVLTKLDRMSTRLNSSH